MNYEPNIDTDWNIDGGLDITGSSPREAAPEPFDPARTVKTDDEGKRYVQIKQKGFIENMYAKWKHQIVEKNPAKEQFPPKSFLSFHDKEGERVDTSDEECKTVLQLGYQKVVGEQRGTVTQNAQLV